MTSKNNRCLKLEDTRILGNKNGFLSSKIITFSVLGHVQNDFQECHNKARLILRFMDYSELDQTNLELLMIINDNCGKRSIITMHFKVKNFDSC